MGGWLSTKLQLLLLLCKCYLTWSVLCIEVKEAHSCLYKEANHGNVKRSSVPVVAEGLGGMHFVARAPTKKPAKFHPPPTFPSWGKSGRKFRPTNPSPPLTLSDRAEIHKLRSPTAQELIRVVPSAIPRSLR